MAIPERTQARLGRALHAIPELLYEWADRIDDRTSPLPDSVAEAIADVLCDARAVVAREPGRARIPAAPKTPGEAVVALMMAEVALVAYLEHRGLLPHELSPPPGAVV